MKKNIKMNFIKYLDLFNIKFSFYTNNQPNNQSFFGGIMTFIYFLISLLVFLFLSYDDIKMLIQKQQNLKYLIQKEN